MIDYERYCQIKDYHERHHLTVPQIARELHLDERTVRRRNQQGGVRSSPRC